MFCFIDQTVFKYSSLSYYTVKNVMKFHELLIYTIKSFMKFNVLLSSQFEFNFMTLH